MWSGKSRFLLPHHSLIPLSEISNVQGPILKYNEALISQVDNLDLHFRRYPLLIALRLPKFS